MECTGELNRLAVVVATPAYRQVGALWYSPVMFAEAWMRALGVTMPEEGPRPRIFPFPKAAYLLRATGFGN